MKAMLDLNIEAAPGTIKSATTKSTITEGSGPDAEPTDLKKVTMPVEIDVTEIPDCVGSFFDGLDEQLKLLAADETGRNGFKLVPTDKFRPVTIGITANGKEIFRREDCDIKIGRLQTYAGGDAKLFATIGARATFEEADMIDRHLGADVTFEIHPTQLDLTDFEPDRPKTRVRK